MANSDLSERFQVFAKLAGKLVAEGSVDKAISICEKGIRIYPHYEEAKLILGEAYLTKGMLAEAKGKLDEVLGADQGNLRALQGLMEIAQREEDVDRAVQISQMILEIEPSHQKARGLLEEYEAKEAPKLEKVSLEVEETREIAEGLSAEEKPTIEPPSLEPSEVPPEAEVARPEEEVEEKLVTEPPLVEEPEVEKAPPEEEEPLEVSPREAAPPEEEVEEELAPQPAESPAVEEVEREEGEPPLKETAEAKPEMEVESTEAPPLEEEEALLPKEGEITPSGEEKPSSIGLEEGIERLESEFAGIETPTLAEIYHKQGLLEKALEVYKRLLEKIPESEEYKARIERIKREMEEAMNEN